MAARRKLDRLQQAYEAECRLDPDVNSKAAIARIQAIIERRLELAKKAEKARARYKDLQASGGSEREIDAARAEERSARSALTAEPSLGTWEVPKERPVGKPPLPPEVAVIRARNELKSAEERRRAAEAEAGVPSLDIDRFEDPVRGTKVGRPAMDELSQLDYKLRRIEQDIARIRALPEEAFDPPEHGRRTMTRQTRIAKRESDADKLRRKISEGEAKLNPLEQLQRERTKKLHDRYVVRRAHRDGHISGKAMDRKVRKLDKEVEQLEAQIAEKESEPF